MRRLEVLEKQCITRVTTQKKLACGNDRYVGGSAGTYAPALWINVWKVRLVPKRANNDNFITLSVLCQTGLTEFT